MPSRGLKVTGVGYATCSTSAVVEYHGYVPIVWNWKCFIFSTAQIYISLTHLRIHSVVHSLRYKPYLAKTREYYMYCTHNFVLQFTRTVLTKEFSKYYMYCTYNFFLQILHVLYSIFFFNFFSFQSPVKTTGSVLCILYSGVRSKNNTDKMTPHKRQELCHTK